MREFKECHSEYQIPDKVDEEDISSEGEFNEAKKAQVLDESCTEVFLIEKKQAYMSKTGREMPLKLVEEAKVEKANGAKADRDLGNKHFTKVGFTQSQ